MTLVDPDTCVLHHFRFHYRVPLNESHPDHLVNVLDYWEISPTKVAKKVARAGKVQYFRMN